MRIRGSRAAFIEEVADAVLFVASDGAELWVSAT
jgi:hypothetical protein